MQKTALLLALVLFPACTVPGSRDEDYMSPRLRAQVENLKADAYEDTSCTSS